MRKMFIQDADEFADGFRIGLDAVSAFDDPFAFGLVEMRAFVFHDAIGSARYSGFPIVADDGMVDDPFGERHFGETFHHGIIRTEIVDSGLEMFLCDFLCISARDQFSGKGGGVPDHFDW